MAESVVGTDHPFGIFFLCRSNPATNWHLPWQIWKWGGSYWNGFNVRHFRKYTTSFFFLFHVFFLTNMKKSWEKSRLEVSALKKIEHCKESEVKKEEGERTKNSPRNKIATWTKLSSFFPPNIFSPFLFYFFTFFSFSFFFLLLYSLLFFHTFLFFIFVE